MTLGELAFVSFVFSRLDTGSYERLLDETDGCIELSKLDHRLATIRWLSAWGIRAIPRNYHETPSDMSDQMKSWYESNALFEQVDRDRNLHELTDNDFVSVRTAYNNLLNVRYVGPTAAAKILFAVRPKALMMWDEPIKKALRHSGKAESYVNFLKQIQSMVRNVEELCKKYGFELMDLPNKLGRPNLTIPKLIDEYLWLTITKGLKPSKDDFQRWAEWG